MAFYQLKKEQDLPIDIPTAWDFLSNPANLKVITPDHMGFHITSDIPMEMYPGMIITYKVSPILGLKLDWITEITQVKHHEYFIDEQRLGPYTMWHHQHFIEPIPNGVKMKDIITYIPPLGPLGAIANTLFIKRQLAGVFKYRKQALEKKFGVYSG